MADAPKTQAVPPRDALVQTYRLSPTPAAASEKAPGTVPEIGGRKDGTDPTRYGDWERNGRCIDF